MSERVEINDNPNVRTEKTEESEKRVSALSSSSSRSGVPELDEVRMMPFENTIEELFSNELRELPLKQLEKEVELLPYLYTENPEITDETELYQKLFAIISKNGNRGLLMILTSIQSGQISAYPAREVLLMISELCHDASLDDRIWLLGANLMSSSPIIREGAILGLANIDDPKTIPYLERAYENEKVPVLRKIILKVIHQLEKHFSENSY